MSDNKEELEDLDLSGVSTDGFFDKFQSDSVTTLMESIDIIDTPPEETVDYKSKYENLQKEIDSINKMLDLYKVPRFKENAWGEKTYYSTIDRIHLKLKQY